MALSLFLFLLSRVSFSALLCSFFFLGGRQKKEDYTPVVEREGKRKEKKRFSFVLRCVGVFFFKERKKGRAKKRVIFFLLFVFALSSEEARCSLAFLNKQTKTSVAREALAPRAMQKPRAVVARVKVSTTMVTEKSSRSPESKTEKLFVPPSATADGDGKKKNSFLLLFSSPFSLSVPLLVAPVAPAVDRGGPAVPVDRVQDRGGVPRDVEVPVPAPAPPRGPRPAELAVEKGRRQARLRQRGLEVPGRPQGVVLVDLAAVDVVGAEEGEEDEGARRGGVGRGANRRRGTSVGKVVKVVVEVVVVKLVAVAFSAAASSRRHGRGAIDVVVGGRGTLRRRREVDGKRWSSRSSSSDAAPCSAAA